MIFFKRDKDLMLFNLNEKQYSQKGALAFILVYIFATVFGAVLTPIFYDITEYMHGVYPDNETFSYLLKKGIDKYFDRLRWVGVLIGLPLIFKYCGLCSIKSLALVFDSNARKVFLKYFILGSCVMLSIYAMQLIFTDMSFKGFTFSSFISALFKSISGAVVLGFLEEIVFRGLIFRCFYTAWGVLPAMLLSSLFFAYKHFKVPYSVLNELDLHVSNWYSGFMVAYYDTIGIFMSFRSLEFGSLTLLALFLCAIYMKTKTLYAPIAFHMAVVFALKLHREFFIVKEDNLREIFGNAAATNSYISVTILSFLLIFTLLKLKKREESS